MHLLYSCITPTAKKTIICFFLKKNSIALTHLFLLPESALFSKNFLRGACPKTPCRNHKVTIPLYLYNKTNH